jgi:hypothetical protein
VGSDVAARLLRGGGASFAAGSRVSGVDAFEPDSALKVAENHDVTDESFSAGAATSTGAARDGVAVTTSRVTRERVACATLVGRGRDFPPTFLRYQQCCFVAWLMR